jgi:hypothetical protein
VLELPPDGQPHLSRPKAWMASEPANAPCSFFASWPIAWMPVPS